MSSYNKILVTGANGQLAQCIKNIAHQYSDFEFIFCDKSTLNITDANAVEAFFKIHQPQYCINTAAYTAVDKAESDVEQAFLVNEKAVEYLAKAASQYGSQLIHISTDYVFDGNLNIPYSEEASVNPTSVYGKSKLAGEQVALQQHPTSIIIRTSWVYATYGNNFLKTMMRLMQEREQLNVVVDQVGTPTSAHDLAEALMQVVQYLPANPTKQLGGIYHYSNEGVASWFDFAKTIAVEMNWNGKLLPILSAQFPTAAKRPHFSVLDKTKIKSAFQLTIPYWRDSVVNCMKKMK